VLSLCLQVDHLTASLAPDGLDWDFAKRYPDCKSWLEIIPPEKLVSSVQYGTRVTQAEWEAGKQQRISNWYKDIIATSSTSQLALNATSLTCPVLDLWYDTDKGSWPAGLESLWENISNSSIRAIVDNVRSHLC
jgi:hypothetical protein